jgi:hypothetical protein
MTGGPRSLVTHRKLSIPRHSVKRFLYSPLWVGPSGSSMLVEQSSSALKTAVSDPNPNVSRPSLIVSSPDSLGPGRGVVFHCKATAERCVQLERLCVKRTLLVIPRLMVELEESRRVERLKPGTVVVIL